MKNTIKKTIDKSAYIARLMYIQHFKDFVLIAFGVAMASIGLKCFLLPNDFLDGGSMGLSLLLNILTHIDLSLLIIAINVPFIILGAKQISIAFAIKSSLAIACLAILIHFVHIPLITSDKLLIAVFGGFFLGAGIGLSIRGGAVIDGTEVLAINISRHSSLSVGDFITVFNILLFSLAAFFINIETAMYSMLTYLSASKTVDFIINGVEEYIGVFIVSKNHATEIKKNIIDNLNTGLTVLNSEKGYGKQGELSNNGNVLYCVVTRLEITKLLLEIAKIDANAFVVQQKIKDIKGGKIKKRHAL